MDRGRVGSPGGLGQVYSAKCRTLGTLSKKCGSVSKKCGSRRGPEQS